jgi:phospholipase D1/2
MARQKHSAVLRPGHNCWRREQAERVAIAVDGEAYFRAVREAILRARRSVNGVQPVSQYKN